MTASFGSRLEVAEVASLSFKFESREKRKADQIQRFLFAGKLLAPSLLVKLESQQPFLSHFPPSRGSRRDIFPSLPSLPFSAARH